MKYILFAILFLAVAINAFRMKQEEGELTDEQWDSIPDEVMDALFPVDDQADGQAASRLQTQTQFWWIFTKKACLGKCNNRNRHHFHKIDCNKKC